MKKVYYSLTGRGFYSEILNMLLAIIYCKKNDLTIIINTYCWNSRDKKGWEDYFLPTLRYTNQFSSSQIYFTGNKHRSNLRSIYKNPIKEVKHYTHCIANYFFKKRTNQMLSDDIIFSMRNQVFIESLGSKENWINEFNKNIKQIYRYNNNLKEEINIYKERIGISKLNFIGVHVRRGDKIKSKEMENIHLQKYIDAIRKQKEICNIYIATDDISIIDELKVKLGEDYNVFHNIFLSKRGFEESKFNRMKKAKRILETKLAILDVDILSSSAYFIGTYSSNLSRIIPCFIGLDKCESIDIEWSPIF